MHNNSMTTSDYAHPEVLVDTQWLADHLSDKTLRVLEVDMSPDRYQGAHIPGAIFINIMTALMTEKLQLNLEVSAFEQLMSQLGITRETTVVAYGSYPGTGGFIFWLFKLFGHPDVRVLNGGYQSWIAEGRSTAAALSTYAPAPYQASPIAEALRVGSAEVMAAVNQSEKVLLDVRSQPEYNGEIFLMAPPEGSERAGHIPGAVHLEHSLTLNDDGTFKSFEDLQALFCHHGITPDKEILPYCAIGARAGYVWFVLKYLLGYPHVRNYDGSWNTWSRLPNALVE